MFICCRDEQLTALQSGKEYDVLVIGGGVTGCGIALDSTLRGKVLILVFAFSNVRPKAFGKRNLCYVLLRGSVILERGKLKHG